jgi:hypothetical protein
MLVGMDVDWAVDGGVTTLNLRRAVSAGASIIVAWCAVFKDGTVAPDVAALRAATGAARLPRGDEKRERLLLRATGATATGYAGVEVPCSYPESGAVWTTRRHGGLAAHGPKPRATRQLITVQHSKALNMIGLREHIYGLHFTQFIAACRQHLDVTGKGGGVT